MRKIGIAFLLITVIMCNNLNTILANDENYQDQNGCYYELNEEGEYELICPIDEGDEYCPIVPNQEICEDPCWGRI